MPNRHPTDSRSRTLARACERGNKRQIERLAPGVFQSLGQDREAWDTSSEWLDSIRGAIHDAEAALSGTMKAQGRTTTHER